MTGSPRILLVYLHAELPSSRIRILQMAPWLERNGLEVEAILYPRNRGGWAELKQRASGCDAILLQKKLPGLLDGLRWRRLGKPIVFDFDDALPFRQVPKKGVWTSSTRHRRFERALSCSQGVIAGNRYLAELCGNHPSVCIAASAVPFPVPTREETAAEPNAKPIVGWIGGRGNLGSLADIGEALRKASNEVPFRLHVVSNDIFSPDGVESLHIPWSLKTQEQEVARFDIGLMPLEDTPWNRGKCAYKALQYMAAGVPTIASPVGMNTELIRPGHNGLLAEEIDDWAKAIKTLLTDVEARERMGRAGLASVQHEYTFAALGERVASYLRQVIEDESAPGR